MEASASAEIATEEKRSAKERTYKRNSRRRRRRKMTSKRWVRYNGAGRRWIRPSIRRKRVEWLLLLLQTTGRRVEPRPWLIEG